MEKLINDLLNKVFNGDAKVVSPLVGGMMNQSYIIESKGKKYVLYISTEQANEMVDRPLEQANQKMIYDLGLTSKNIYFDTDKGIKINEYIEGNSLNNIDTFDSKKVAALLKAMHTSGKLSRDNYNPFKRFVAYEDEANGFITERFEGYEELRKAIFNNQDFLESNKLALCHNDAQKSNIVRDLQDNYYLIDFEFMGNNDPIYDIATFGNNVVEEGYQVLCDYFDGNPTIDEKKRYYLWRIFVSLQWHNVAIVKHYRGEGKTHGFNFLAVARFFLENAKTAYRYLEKL